MKFKCIKTLEDTLYKVGTPFNTPFIKGEIYEVNPKDTDRKRLTLIDESKGNHTVAQHWLYWKLDKWWKEYFTIIE